MINCQSANPAENKPEVKIDVQEKSEKMAEDVKIMPLPTPVPEQALKPSPMDIVAPVHVQPSIKSPTASVPKETVKDQGSAAELSERFIKEEAFISTSNNDEYHERILSDFKLDDNKALNDLFYKHVPQLKKSSLLTLDLSLAQNVFRQNLTTFRTNE